MTEDSTKSSKHTPGPWSRSIDDGQTGWVKASEGTIIAKVPSAGWDDTQWLNHRLIAAAPDMLAALSDLADAYEVVDAHLHDEIGYGELEPDECLVEARAAIAKAEEKP